jgi:hypothetical protein
MATTSQGPDAPTPSKETAPFSSAAEVEMNTLSAAQPESPTQTSAEPDTTGGASDAPLSSDQASTTPARLTRLQSEAGLGPATESPIVPPLPTTDRGPILSITLMLTTGARHPYKIDEKYLRSRKVEGLGGEASTDGESTFDPREISGYKLKELIWTDWRSEWEPRPASPSSIRLIILGRLVEDKAALKGKSHLLNTERSYWVLELMW